MTIPKGTQNRVPFLRKNKGMVNKEIDRKCLGIYLLFAAKIQINSVFEAF